MSAGPVRINDVRCLRETDKALFIEVDGVRSWIPKSVVHDDSEVCREDDVGDLVVVEWFAEKQGWT